MAAKAKYAAYRPDPVAGGKAAPGSWGQLRQIFHSGLASRTGLIWVHEGRYYHHSCTTLTGVAQKLWRIPGRRLGLLLVVCCLPVNLPPAGDLEAFGEEI